MSHPPGSLCKKRNISLSVRKEHLRKRLDSPPPRLLALPVVNDGVERPRLDGLDIAIASVEGIDLKLHTY